MSRPYFFLEKNFIGNDTVTLSGKDFNHLAKVLRVKKGEHVDISDNSERKYTTIVSDIKKDSAVLSITGTTKIKKRMPCIKLFLCILKKEAMETAIQKTVEIGIDSITPVISRRVISDLKDGNKMNKKIARWQQIAFEASKQCKRDFICKINNPLRIEDFKAGASDILYMAIENIEPLQPVKKYLPESASSFNSRKLSSFKSIGYIIGPEGGFEDYEKEKVLRIGAVPFNFGKNILRAETAAIYFLSVLDYLVKSS